MSEQEKRITIFRDGRERVAGIKFKPEYFSFPTLIRIAAFQFYHPENRQCILLEATRRVVVSSDYLKQVSKLESDLRRAHILDTAIAMRRAIEVHIQQRVSE